MDKTLTKCFKKWARIIKPNANLSEAYVKKARNDLIVLRSISPVGKEWKAATAYYARYHILTALLLKTGIDCKDHNCSINIAEYLFSDVLDKKLFSELRTAKRHRINLQYYTDRPVAQKELETSHSTVFKQW